MFERNYNKGSQGEKKKENISELLSVYQIQIGTDKRDRFIGEINHVPETYLSDRSSSLAMLHDLI